MSSTVLLFSTNAYTYLRDAVARQIDAELGAVEVREFPDGERYQRIEGAVHNRDIALIGGTISDADTLAIYDLASAVVHYGARSLSLFLPYFGYSTMERASKPGEVVTAKTRARLLSAIPEAHLGNRIFMLDLHAEGIPHYFEDSVRAFHLYASDVVKEAAKELGGEDFVLACTDAGRAKWVESLASDLGVHAAFIIKRRIDGRRTEVAGVSANVRGKPVVIYDDMIRTGGSLIGAARAYKTRGATRISAITTHGVFPKGAKERLESSGLFDQIVATDSHPNAVAQADDFLQIRSVANILARAFEAHP